MPSKGVKGSTGYWAFNANPDQYRVQEAVRERVKDLWWVDRSNPGIGELVIIWKSKGKSKTRGVVAFGEVLSEPQWLADEDNPHWVNVNDAWTEKRRVCLRYIQAPGLPLWDDYSDTSVFQGLTVRGNQGTVFVVQPDQWRRIVEAAGGIRVDPPEVEDALVTLSEATGRASRGQGYRMTVDERKAVEQHAVATASVFYAAKGWDVIDVSAACSYDLLCRRRSGEALHVEVKGTVSDGARVMVTAGEVRHSRECEHSVLLLI